MSLSFNKSLGAMTVGGANRSSKPTTTIGEYSQPKSHMKPPPPSSSTAEAPTSTRARFHEKNSRDNDADETRWQHLYVLPVLLLEFLALALTRAALPSMLVKRYGDSVYVVMGISDCIRGLLAFMACPLFGKLSDMIGRRVCLFITVMGTCAPVCSLALFSWQITPSFNNNAAEQESQFLNKNESKADSDSTSLDADGSSDSGGFWPIIWGSDSSEDSEDVTFEEILHPIALPIFIVLLAFSGIFSSTFTLVFAYISDTVQQQEERVSAYGLALATFGLSFTIGPIAGGYLARSHKQYVFLGSFILTFLDLLYIYAILPESRQPEVLNTSVQESITLAKHEISWNPVDTIRLIAVDPFLRKVSKVAFLYYTGLWALISTFSVYAVKRFHLGPERLGELMSALGLCTMVAEAVLVRIMVPMFGEKQSIKIGLVSFAIQCFVLGFAFEPWHLFACAVFSMLGNLVYPSLSSLVSGSVEPSAVGEALGAVNGIKALTEGIGPLVFGSLMTLSEKTPLPGWPYLLAGLLVIAAYQATDELPDPEDDNHEYIHELERKRTKPSTPKSARKQQKLVSGFGGLFSTSLRQNAQDDKEGDVELESLLSDAEEESDSTDT